MAWHIKKSLEERRSSKLLAVLSTTSTKSLEMCTSCVHNSSHLSKLHCTFFSTFSSNTVASTQQTKWGTILYELPLYCCLFWLRSVDFKRAVFVLRDCSNSCLYLSSVQTRNKGIMVIWCVCARDKEWIFTKTITSVLMNNRLLT